MTKKGDLSINIIVIAAIALIILVIMAVLLFQAGGNLNRGTSCEGVGGECIDKNYDGSCSDYSDYTGIRYKQHIAAGCPSKEQICCVPIGN